MSHILTSLQYPKTPVAAEASSPNTRDPEIISRLDRTDQALGELKNVVEVLTTRLIPVMTEVARGDGSDAEEPICSTPIGQRLQAQESFVRNATNAVQSILYRLEI